MILHAYDLLQSRVITVIIFNLLVKEGKTLFYYCILKFDCSCWSYLGKQPPGRYARPQLVSLASGCYLAIPAHEIMHALGRFHEQSRADRDTYVRIITGNISTDMHTQAGIDFLYFRKWICRKFCQTNYFRQPISTI